MKRKLSCIVLSTALVVSLVAGAGGEDAMAAKKAKLATKKITLTQGKTKKIKVKNKKKGCRYTFTSNKKKVATVTKKGKVKAVAAGTAKITVKEVSKKDKKRKIGVVKVLVKKNSQTTVTPQTSTNPQTSTTPGGANVTATPKAPTVSATPKVSEAPTAPTVSATPKVSEAPTVSATPSTKPQESKEPTKGTKSVSVYLDEIKEANKIAEVNGPGLDPTAAPTETPATEPTAAPAAEVTEAPAAPEATATPAAEATATPTPEVSASPSETPTPEVTETPAETTEFSDVSVDNAIANVSLSTPISEKAVLVAKQYDEDSEYFDNAIGAVMNWAGQNNLALTEAVVYDLHFENEDGSELPYGDNATVNLQFINPILNDLEYDNVENVKTYVLHILSLIHI